MNKTIKIFILVGLILTSIQISSANIYINDSNSGDLFNMEIPDTEVSYSYIIYHPWYASTLTVAKNGTTGKIDYSGTNDSYILQTVIDKQNQYIIIKSNLNLTSNISITTPTIIEGMIPKNIDSTPILNYTGSYADSLIYMSSCSDGSIIKNIALNGNNNIGIGIYYNVLTANSLHQAKLENIVLKGYSSYGLVTGVNNTTSTNSGQMSDFSMKNIWFAGGVLNATGWLSNGQNIEWASVSNIRFDPPTTAKSHLYHIYNRYGAIKIDGMISTRANSYAIYTNEQIDITGWRSEDAFLLNTPSAAIPPISIRGLQHRPASPVTTTIRYNGIGNSSLLSVSDSTIDGNILVGGTNERYINIQANFINGKVTGGNNMNGIVVSQYLGNQYMTFYNKGNQSTFWGKSTTSPTAFASGDTYRNTSKPVPNMCSSLSAGNATTNWVFEVNGTAGC